MTTVAFAAASSTGQPQPQRDPAADLATFFDVSLDLLVIRDLDGFIVRVSASWAATLGYEPDDLIGLGHPDPGPS